MPNNDLIKDIIGGCEEEENPVDVLTMCNLATTVCLYFEISELSFDDERSDEPQSLDDRYIRTLRRIGKIFCPLTDIVKPDDYKTEMIQARLQFRTISIDPDLQRSFTTRVVTLANDGALSSVENAVELKIWQHLQLELELTAES